MVMKNSLLDLLFLSEKRKNILLLLKEKGPKSVETLRKNLNESETSIQPQLKKLRENHLVVREDNLYRLSEIGIVIVEKLPPLLNTIQVFEENEDYWASRDLKSIPPSFLQRIGELGKYKISEPDRCNHFMLIPSFSQSLISSKEIKAFISYFHPLLPPHILGTARDGRKITLIVNKMFMERVVCDFRPEIEAFLRLDNTKMYLCKEPAPLPTVLATDIIAAIAFYPKKGMFDRSYVVSFDQSALLWGEDLFEHIRYNSEEITELPA